ncbi:MAG TPA: sugar phosphate isomerase/epimerase [Planctomicrobium sp.]|nr:sugar phosphate isomerase/epimerase [Planctomicrobium sp.]
MPFNINRREACRLILASAVACTGSRTVFAQPSSPFRLNYSLASSMYGCLPLEEILPEVRKIGAETIDLWPLKHGNQRNQVTEMGEEAFRQLLSEHQVRLGMTTRYDLGPFKLAQEIEFVSRLGGRMIVTGAPSTKIPATREQVHAFVKTMTPHVKLAQQHGIILAIENHSNSLINHPDTLRWFAEAIDSPNIGIAFAPYHLPQDPTLLQNLIVELGAKLVHFYAWEHGDGCMEKLPKEQELKQLPGRGSLNFGPLLAGLKAIQFNGWTQIFMHPVPRGIPIMESVGECTKVINQARQYLDQQHS